MRNVEVYRLYLPGENDHDSRGKREALMAMKKFDIIGPFKLFDRNDL
jgi:hypothetical protein